ncbi:MAG: type II toxin-antitoxin system Y4mF family antitoxin [Planctomycetota bacterium]|jgi:y4mF family transcriptional regulator
MRQHVIRNSRELGKVVRQRRKTLALTQAALAAVAGVGVRFVSELERGKQTAEFQRVLNVLHVLGMDLEVVARAEADP